MVARLAMSKMKGGKDGFGSIDTETKRVNMSCESIFGCLVRFLVDEQNCQLICYMFVHTLMISHVSLGCNIRC